VFSKAFDGGGNSILHKIIRRRMPVHWSCMSDGFQPIERKLRISEQILDILNQYNYPTVMDTKGFLIMDKPWREKALSLKHVVFQTSMICHNEPLRKALEPGVGNDMRIEMLRMFRDAGIPTVVRIQPVIPLISTAEDLCELVEMTKGVADHYTIEFMRMASDSGRYMKISSRLNLIPNLYEQYRNHPQIRYFNRQFTFSKELKGSFITPVIEKVHSIGHTIGVKDNTNYMVMNDTESCCGVERYPGFENIFKRNYLQACWQLKKKGQVCHADIMGYEGLTPKTDAAFDISWEKGNRLRDMVNVMKDGAYYKYGRCKQTCLNVEDNNGECLNLS
jgi:DNA repair photolyase